MTASLDTPTPTTVTWQDQTCLLPAPLAQRFPAPPARDGEPVAPSGGTDSDRHLDAWASSWMEGVRPSPLEYARAVIGLPTTGAGWGARRAHLAYAAQKRKGRAFSARVLTAATTFSGTAIRWRTSLVRLETPTGFFVPAPPVHVPDLMADLDAFEAREGLDPLFQAVTVHGQFEAIHPLHDGNGRVGRAALAAALWRGGLPVGAPSVLLAQRREDYLDALRAFTGTASTGGDAAPLQELVADACRTVHSLGTTLPAFTGDSETAAQGTYTRLDHGMYAQTALWEAMRELSATLNGRGA